MRCNHTENCHEGDTSAELTRVGDRNVHVVVAPATWQEEVAQQIEKLLGAHELSCANGWWLLPVNASEASLSDLHYLTGRCRSRERRENFEEASLCIL